MPDYPAQARPLREPKRGVRLPSRRAAGGPHSHRAAGTGSAFVRRRQSGTSRYPVRHSAWHQSHGDGHHVGSAVGQDRQQPARPRGRRHHRLRKLVSKAFTPRASARLHDTIVDVINDLIDALPPKAVATSSTTSPGPTRPVICALLGAPGRTGNSSPCGPTTSSRPSASIPTVVDEEPRHARVGRTRRLRRRHGRPAARIRSPTICCPTSSAPRRTATGSTPTSCACLRPACCSREPTPPATRWPRRSTSSAITPTSGRCCRTIPSWRRGGRGDHAAFARSPAARCGP